MSTCDHGRFIYPDPPCPECGTLWIDSLDQSIKWNLAPNKITFGDSMVIADLEIDKDHSLTLYCEKDQVEKVHAMLSKPDCSLEKELRATIEDLLIDVSYYHREWEKEKAKNAPEEGTDRRTPCG